MISMKDKCDLGLNPECELCHHNFECEVINNMFREEHIKEVKSMKCDIPSCRKDIESFDPVKPRIDGIALQILSTSRIYVICNECAQKLEFTR